MSALRDVVARMAVDSEFARHARAHPDQVAREHNLTAEEAAKLRGLADAGSGGGPMALGARLSKSGIGTGGLAAGAAGVLEMFGDESSEEPTGESVLGNLPDLFGDAVKVVEEDKASQFTPPGDSGSPLEEILETAKGLADDNANQNDQQSIPPLQGLAEAVKGLTEGNGNQDTPHSTPPLQEAAEAIKDLPLPSDDPAGDVTEVEYDFPDLQRIPQGGAPSEPAAEQGQPGAGPGGTPSSQPPVTEADQPAPAGQPAPAASGPLADQSASASPALGPAPTNVGGVSGQAQSLLPPAPSPDQPDGGAGIGAAGLALGAAGLVVGGVAGGVGGAVAGRAAAKSTRDQAPAPDAESPTTPQVA